MATTTVSKDRNPSFHRFVIGVADNWSIVVGGTGPDARGVAVWWGGGGDVIDRLPDGVTSFAVGALGATPVVPWIGRQTDPIGGVSTALHVRRYPPAAEPVDELVAITENEAVGVGVACDGRAACLVVYNDWFTWNGLWLDRDGRPVGETFVLAGSASASGRPYVAAAGGRFLVTWDTGSQGAFVEGGARSAQVRSFSPSVVDLCAAGGEIFGLTSSGVAHVLDWESTRRPTVELLPPLTVPVAPTATTCADEFCLVSGGGGAARVSSGSGDTSEERTEWSGGPSATDGRQILLASGDTLSWIGAVRASGFAVVRARALAWTGEHFIGLVPRTTDFDVELLDNPLTPPPSRTVWPADDRRALEPTLVGVAGGALVVWSEPATVDDDPPSVWAQRLGVDGALEGAPAELLRESGVYEVRRVGGAVLLFATDPAETALSVYELSPETGARQTGGTFVAPIDATWTVFTGDAAALFVSSLPNAEPTLREIRALRLDRHGAPAPDPVPAEGFVVARGPDAQLGTVVPLDDRTWQFYYGDVPTPRERVLYYPEAGR